ncbi:hypothetical protein D9V41_03885 [Aeromicrobium phragmitis]|uniref:DUF4352 domain-containing protein n=1 Tax=Aeromicrobium phragmitis TaxID=2478914 RepID=A0A3L8PR30_9ACTN|nr:hypothetical protein D9V41_03885 [Aeromicrobium phragmitis]
MLAAALLVAACSGEGEEKEPTGLELPEGVSLTEGGSELDPGDPATVAYPDDTEDATALTVTVDTIQQGRIEDFALFSLSPEDAASTPFYVTVTVANEGPGTPGTTSLPIFANDGENTLISPNAIVGTFEPCAPTPIPADLPAGDEVTQCLVYLLPEGASLESVDLQVADAAEAIHWRPEQPAP